MYDVMEQIQSDHSTCSKPPVDFETKVPLWPGPAWPGQNGTFVLKSTGGFEQVEWSPCSSASDTGKKCTKDNFGNVVVSMLLPA